MLENTFRHLSGYGVLKERRLWAQGICDWDSYEERAQSQLSLFSQLGEATRSELEDSRRALGTGDTDFFAVRLPKPEHYRIALTYPEDVLFLDIETTGLSLFYDEITLIGLSLGGEYRFHVAGQPLGSITDWIARAKCVVTFNGTLFDLKFLRQTHPELRLPKAHVDLRFLGRSVGLRGGQKEIERLIGFDRLFASDMSGEAAPLLWHEYLMGNIDAFRKLVEYNRADVEGMKAIFDVAAERLIATRAIPSPRAQRPFSRLGSPPLKWVNGVRASAGAVQVPSVIASRGPQITYKELIASCPVESSVKAVGIDLTGSAARPSGWCLLDGPDAATVCLRTDEEILRHTMEARPDVVSIDSPLSVPRGRKLVGSGNSSREAGSIVRDCERMLKRRGINVYPCLLPSMRMLTERGIRLANLLRAEGLPVIESYPGAAQDIMRIPRKRAGLQYLIRGLADFGVRGNFVHGKVTHDEVDAVTSGLVGTFFWCGRFEALGSEDEDYLIVPDLRTAKNTWHERRVVGISGPIAAGKTTAATTLRERGFAYTRYSDVLADMLREEGRPVERRALQELGEQVHLNPGQRWLSKQVLSRVPADAKLVVVDGLRFPEDHAFFTERFGPNFLHLYIEAPREIRQQRYLAVGLAEADFERVTSHPVENGVPLMASLAHMRLENSGSLESFKARVVQAIAPSEERVTV
jgi:uncharacterized protein YprB with RNaseH-like and TPR domain/predicted nuclease with RNAse H fold/dephospho-CoA kinase